MLIEFLRDHSWSSNDVIRKPLNTKKMSTPKKPPGVNVGVKCWPRTSRIEIPRTPSSSGRYPSLNSDPAGIGICDVGDTVTGGAAYRKERDDVNKIPPPARCVSLITSSTRVLGM